MSGGRGGRQGELVEAVSAPAAREQTVEYLDDFESDEDGVLNGTGKALSETSSGAESAKESLVVECSLSDDDTSLNTDLEKETDNDLTLSSHESKLFESENTQQDGRDSGEECLESRNEGDDGKTNEDLSAAEEISCDHSASDLSNCLSVNELQKRRHQEGNKPVPKPRVHKARTARASDQDQTISTGDLKLDDSSRKCRSGTGGTLTTTCETTQKLEKSADCSSDETVKMAEGQTVADTVQEVSVGDESEQAEEKSTSKDPVKKQSGTKERAQQTHRAALSERSVSSARLKKKARAAPSVTPVSSRYLGNLKVLEEKGDQKKSPEFDQADSLRAAVFQNWLEKKKAFLLESKRAEKKKAENLRNTAEKDEAAKREEAIASFEAWKKKKEREAKKLNEKKKLEELKKKKAAEQNEEKTEAAQKAFEKWKERKAEYFREQSRKEKQSERIRKKKEEELVAEKKRGNLSAVEKWNEKKDEYIKQKKVERDLERRKQELQQAKKEEKNKKALEEYEKWLEKTERREQLEKKRKKLQAVRGDEVPSPWSPPGKVSYSRNY